MTIMSQRTRVPTIRFDATLCTIDKSTDPVTRKRRVEVSLSRQRAPA
jgi:hypothetical protein